MANAEFAGFAPKQKYTGWTVLQNADGERTYQSKGICVRLGFSYNNIQLFPEEDNTGEVNNSGGYIPRREALHRP